MNRRVVLGLTLVVVLATAYLLNDARETARLGACVQRGIDHHQAAGTYPLLQDGSPAAQEVARVCTEDADAWQD